MGEIPIRGTGQLVLPQSVRDNQVIAKSPVTVAEPAPITPPKSTEPVTITAPARSDFDPSITLPVPSEFKANLNANVLTFGGVGSTAMLPIYGVSLKPGLTTLNPSTKTNFEIAKVSTDISLSIKRPDDNKCEATTSFSNSFWDFDLFADKTPKTFAHFELMKFDYTYGPPAPTSVPTVPTGSDPTKAPDDSKKITEDIKNNFKLGDFVDDYKNSINSTQKGISTSIDQRKEQINNIIAINDKLNVLSKTDPIIKTLSETDAKAFISASEILTKMTNPEYHITKSDKTTLDSLSSIAGKNKEVLGLTDMEVTKIDTLRNESISTYKVLQTLVQNRGKTNKAAEELLANAKETVTGLNKEIDELEGKTRTPEENSELKVLKDLRTMITDNVLNSNGQSPEQWQATMMLVGPAIKMASQALSKEQKTEFSFQKMQLDIDNLKNLLHEATDKPRDQSKVDAFLSALQSTYSSVDSSASYRYFSTILAAQVSEPELGTNSNMSMLSSAGAAEATNPTALREQYPGNTSRATVTGEEDPYTPPTSNYISDAGDMTNSRKIFSITPPKSIFLLNKTFGSIDRYTHTVEEEKVYQSKCPIEAIALFMSQFDAVDMGKWALTADSRKTLDQQITDQGQASLERSNAITNTDINQKIKHIDEMQSEVQSAYDNFDSSKANISDLLRTFREINVKVNNAIAEVHAGTRARTGIDENNTKERKDNRSGWDKADSLAKITKMFNEKARETILRNGTPAEKEQFIKSEKELALYGESVRVSI